MKYIIYKHDLNGKSYIGFTKLSLDKRLEQHIKEAESGSSRHFCRAIKKYGVENIRSTILNIATTKEEAKLLEQKYIKEYDTFNSGYNMTTGGDGGNTIVKMSDEQKKNLSNFRSKMAGGILNSNSAGKTREQILELAFEVLLDNDMNWVYKEYKRRAKEKGYPVNIYNSGMFEKSWQEDLIEYVRQKGFLIIEIKYRPTKEHIQNNAGCRQKGGKWYYNEKLKKSKFFNPNEFDLLTPEWLPGRKMKWD